MKTRKDFMSMKPLDLFFYNGSCKMVDEFLLKDLKKYKNEMKKYCFKQPNPQKFERAKQKYDETLLKKAENTKEWVLCQKVAKQRKINLHILRIS